MSFAALTYRLPRLDRAGEVAFLRSRCMFQEQYCARDFLQTLRTQRVQLNRYGNQKKGIGEHPFLASQAVNSP